MNTPRPQKTFPLSRRDFLKVTGLAGGGLLLSLYLAGCDDTGTPPAPTATLSAATVTPTNLPLTPTLSNLPEPTPVTPAWFEPNLFVKIGIDNLITITVHRSEMGQGVRTALPMLVAEELEVDWTAIRIEQAPGDRRYGNQLTGGSTSIFESYNPLRRAGAVAREMLITAAAQIWEVDPASCYAERGKVFHTTSEKTLPYGELVTTAATLDALSFLRVQAKDPADFHLIGTRMERIDGPQIVNGSAVYGLDIQIPGMSYAVIARPPTLGGKIISFDATNAKAIAGVQQIVEIENGIAVVAVNTWAALQGRRALDITWDDGSNASLSTEGIQEALIARATELSASLQDEKILQATYEVPYYAHATMEPMNCVADVRADRCEIWAPTQAPQEARQTARRITGLPEEAILVHVTLLGGGFGRRLQVDYVIEAVRVSQAINAPVKVVWTRDDDMKNDFYHPFTLHLAHARLDQPALPDIQTFQSPSSIPTGAWRAVTNIPDAFVRECFLDEMAAALGKDPYELRQELEPDILQEVLALAATKAGWGTPLPEGRSRGIACHATWGSVPVAEVVEVSVDGNGRVQVHRVVCAVDCGIVINPDMVEAQMEGGIVFGLTAALKGEGITLENGQVQQSNFDDYPLLQFDEMPEIEVYIVQNTRAPRGVGEMSTPPLIPAVANAIFAATGKPIRRLPIRPEDISGA